MSGGRKRRTAEWHQQQVDEEVRKRVDAILSKPKIETIKITDCEFCLYRRSSDNWCKEHSKEISPKHLACQKFTPGGPDETRPI